MKIRTIEYSKEYKVGLPQYSNMTIGMHMMVELGIGEEPNHDAVWDTINQQLEIQTSIDPSWITKQELKKEWKYTVKTPKQPAQISLPETSK